MKKLLLATIAAVTLLSAPAFAADMAVKALPPAASPAFDWSGFYIGGDLGWQSSRIGLSEAGAPLSYSPDHNGFTGGGFAGVQHQFSQFVVGIEGGYLAATGSRNFGTPSSDVFFPLGTGSGTAKLRDLWSIGGRVGLPFGMWMPYVTGGYGNGHFQFSAATVPANGISQQASSNNDGGYVGAGIDYALMSNWIIGAEYRHYFLGSNLVVQTAGFFPAPPVTFNTRTDTVLARLSYKFNFMH